MDNRPITLPQLIFGFIMILIAVLVVFIPPVAVAIPVVLQFLIPIAGAFGIVDFRKKYLIVESWVKTKTVAGVLFVVVPVLLIVGLPFIPNFEIAEWIMWILKALVLGGSGTFLYGIFNVAEKSKAKVKQ